MDILEQEVEKRMLEHARKTSEEIHLENPTDVDVSISIYLYGIFSNHGF